MKRLSVVTVVVGSLLAVSPASAQAGQKQAAQSVQLPPLTTEQIVMDCALTGAMFSAAGALGLFKPATLALSTMTTFALLHEALYGCGLGVVSGYVGQGLMSLIPMPPPPNPFETQSGPRNNAMLPASLGRP